MSNRKKSKGFIDRTTMGPGQGLIITPPARAQQPEQVKHYVGADHVVTEDEALQMGRALFDAITIGQAAKARRDES